MSVHTSLTSRIEQYVAERRHLGFELSHMEQALRRFARYVKAQRFRGSLTVEVMAAWARQIKGGQADRAAAARALRILRPFMRWLQQFDPATEVPDEATFGAIPGRVAPHIFSDAEIAALIEAAAEIGPIHSLRGAVMQTLFGLIACTGLRISEALALTDADVDLKAGMLTIQRSKFGKSRIVALHPSAVAALRRYRDTRARSVPVKTEQSFFVGTRGRLFGKAVGDRQAHRIFMQLRQQLGWVARGGHGGPRIHDLRHSFAVRRLVLWHQQGADIHQHMLALSTYLGHAKVSNTYWYLTGVPELMKLIGKRFEHFVDLWDSAEESVDA
jgi:integrase